MKCLPKLSLCFYSSKISNVVIIFPRTSTFLVLLAQHMHSNVTKRSISRDSNQYSLRCYYYGHYYFYLILFVLLLLFDGPDVAITLNVIPKHMKLNYEGKNKDKMTKRL